MSLKYHIRVDPDAKNEAHAKLIRMTGEKKRVLELGCHAGEVFGDERFDVVTMGDVLEHLADPLRVLKMAHDLLAPGGCIVVPVPNIAHVSIRLPGPVSPGRRLRQAPRLLSSYLWGGANDKYFERLRAVSLRKGFMEHRNRKK